jgi:hypothetical protein
MSVAAPPEEIDYVRGPPWLDRFILILREGHWGEVDRNPTLVRSMSATYAVNKRSRHFILIPTRFLNFEFLLGKVENE